MEASIGWCATNALTITLAAPSESNGVETYGFGSTSPLRPEFPDDYDIGEVEFGEDVRILAIETEPITYGGDSEITQVDFQIRHFQTGSNPPQFTSIFLVDSGKGGICSANGNIWDLGNTSHSINDGGTLVEGEYTVEFRLFIRGDSGNTGTNYSKRFFFTQLPEPDPQPEPIEFDSEFSVFKTAQISFSTESGCYYNIQHRFVMDSGDWIDSQYSILGTGNDLTRYRVSDSKDLFLRVLKSLSPHTATEPAVGSYAEQLIFVSQP
ncbi:MAG: hypothetical protein ACSHYA_03325 [Opitutaceae bacterium]